MVAHAVQMIPQTAAFNKPSTEMRDTARLVNGRVVFDRAVIMARAWKIARREAAGYAAIGAAAMFPLAKCFAEALKQSWADARAMAWKLTPRPAPTRREALQLVILCAEAAERPSLRDLEDLAAARAELAALSAAA